MEHIVGSVGDRVARINVIGTWLGVGDTGRVLSWWDRVCRHPTIWCTHRVFVIGKTF